MSNGLYNISVKLPGILETSSKKYNKQKIITIKIENRTHVMKNLKIKTWIYTLSIFI